MRLQVSRRNIMVFLLGAAFGACGALAVMSIRAVPWVRVEEGFTIGMGVPDYTLEAFTRVNQELGRDTERFLHGYPKLRQRGLTCYAIPDGKMGHTTVVFFREVGIAVPQTLRDEIEKWVRDSLSGYSIETHRQTTSEPRPPAEPSAAIASEGR